ncbi:MAG: lipopolysaccharide kinase InaA family protein [Planctomycetaceae bacterium]
MAAVEETPKSADGSTRSLWPDDFVRRDEGQLLVRPDLVSLFDRLEWQTFDDLLGASSGDHAVLVRERRRPGGWDNIVLTVERVGDEPLRLHLKRHRPGQGLQRRVMQRRGLQEADAIGACQRAGVPTMEVAAVGVLRPGTSSNEHRFDTLFVSEEIASSETASMAVSRILKADGPSRHEELLRVIDCVAATAARLHGAGLFHGDCHWPHFFLADDGTAKLIDLQGLRQATGVAGRYLWIKDMAQLRESFLKQGVWEELGTAWAECYNRHATACQSVYRVNRWSEILIAIRGKVRTLSVAARRSTRTRRRRMFDTMPYTPSTDDRDQEAGTRAA